MMTLSQIICSLSMYLLMAFSTPVPVEARGTGFSTPEFDRFNSGGLACMVHGRPNREARRLVVRGAYVAHRTLPCWTELNLENPRTGRHEVVVVADRGPYGANRDGIDIFLGTPDEPGVAKRLRHNGDERVRFTPTGRILTKQRRDEREKPNF
jgi:hypothetical protein